MRALFAAVASLSFLSHAPTLPRSHQDESLLAAGQRLARAWQGHDFDTLTAGSTDVLVQLPGAQASGTLRPNQARELLRGYLGGETEVSAEVLVAREVDDARAYVEVQRTFTVRGTAGRRVQTVYFGLRKEAGRWRLYEVRIVA